MWELLTSGRALSVMAAFLAGAIAVGYVQQLRVDAAQAKLKAERTINTNLRADNVACADNVARANQAVQALQDAADARAKAVQEAMAAAEAKAKAQDAEIQRLASRPPSSKNSCVAVTDLRHDYMRTRK